MRAPPQSNFTFPPFHLSLNLGFGMIYLRFQQGDERFCSFQLFQSLVVLQHWFLDILSRSKTRPWLQHMGHNCSQFLLKYGKLQLDFFDVCVCESCHVSRGHGLKFKFKNHLPPFSLSVQPPHKSDCCKNGEQENNHLGQKWWYILSLNVGSY